MATALETDAPVLAASRNGRSDAAESDQPPSTKKKIVLSLVGVVALILLFWGFQKWNYGRSHQTTDNAQVDGHIVPVLAKVGGYVKTVNVSENDHVNAGQLLVQLDDADYRVRFQQAQADLAAAEATAGGGGFSGQAQSQVQSATGQRAALDAQIGAARANANKAEQDLARARELAAKQIISKQQLDAAQATAAVAQANLLAAERQAAAAGGTVNTAEAGVRVANARTLAALSGRRERTASARLHPDHRTGFRRGFEKAGGSRSARRGRPATHEHRCRHRNVGYGQLQGNAARDDPARPARRVRDRRLRWMCRRRKGCQRQRSDGSKVRASSA